MKFGALIGAFLITIVIIILAFQNIAIRSRFYMFFDFENTTLTLPILVLSGLGMIAGALFAFAISGMIREQREEAEDERYGEF